MSNEVKFTIRLNVSGKERVVTATSDLKELSDELVVVADKVSGVKKAMDMWGRNVMALQSLQSSISTLSSEIGGLSSEANAYDRAMRAANTMAGKGSEEFGKLKDSVSGLAKTIPLAREELANGLYQVISNGVPEKNWLNFLEASAKSSVGGLADLGQVVGVTSTIIKNYGLGWESAEAIQDKIQLTAKNGVTSFEQLAAALPRVSSNASTLGVSIDELMATFATLTGVSGNTAEVSTQLAAVFTALVKPSSEAASMAEAMGIEFNAASIKAAGGLQQFLTKLDGAVKTYASAHGMLEEEIYGKLFGSAESLRALGPLTGNLASQFSKNVSTMSSSAGTVKSAFGEMSSTVEAKLQLVKNSFTWLTDGLASFSNLTMPLLSFASNIGIIALSFENVRKSAIVFYGILRNSALVTGMVSFSQKIYNAILHEYRAVVISAAIGTNTLQIAIRGLMVATGVGAAIAGLAYIVYSLMSNSDDAAEKLDELSEAEQKAKAAAEAERAEVERNTAQLHQHIAVCKNFKGTKEEERKIVNTLNNTYGQTMGYFSSVSAWYKALTANSEAYTRQMIAEAKARRLANQIAEKDAQIHNINFDENGNRRQYSTENKTQKETIFDAYGRPVVVAEKEVKNSSDWDAAAKETTRLTNERNALERQLNDTIKDTTASYKVMGSDTAPTFGDTKTPKANKPGKTDKTDTNKTDDAPKLTLAAVTYKQLAENVRYYEQQLESANFTDRESYQELVRKKQVAEKAVESYRKMVEQMKDVEGVNEGAKTVEEMRSNIDVLQKQLEKTEPRSKEYARVTAEMEEWQRRLSDIEDGSIGDMERRIQSIDDRLRREKLDIEAEVKLTAERNNLQKQLDERSKNITFKVEIEGREGNMAEIDRAIQFYSNRQQSEDADNVRKTQDIIDALTKKKGVFELSIDLAAKSREVEEIEKLTSKERVLKIRGIGFDDLSSRIKDLERRLGDMDSPVTSSQRAEMEQLIDTYKRWRKSSIDAFGALKDGWGGVKGIGNGLKSMTDALKGNGDAWSKLSSVIDGFLSIWEGVTALVGIIKMLTEASEAHAAAQTVDVSATLLAAGAEASTAEAGVAAAAAAKEETAAFMELASAKFFAAYASIPFTGFALGAGFSAAAAGIVKSFGNVSAFADGGLAFGPTLGLFGEYPGARSNPEVVAPLDRLSSYLSPSTSSDGKVKFEIAGRKLRGVLKKEERHQSRM